MTQLEVLKSVPSDIHELIKNVDSESLDDATAKRLKLLIGKHGIECIHKQMTPLYMAVLNGKVGHLYRKFILSWCNSRF